MPRFIPYLGHSMTARYKLPIKEALQVELHHKIEAQIASYNKAIASIEESKITKPKAQPVTNMKPGEL